MTAPSPVANLDLVDLCERLFARQAASRTGREPPDDLDQELWRQLVELGLAQLTTAEDRGGSGASWIDAATLIGSAARHGIAVPLVEHDLLAGWLLEVAGLPVDERLRTVALVEADGLTNASARRVAWARSAESIVVLGHRSQEWFVAEATGAEVAISPARNIAGEPRDDVSIRAKDLRWVPVDASTPQLLLLRGALARAVQMSAAVDELVDLTVRHATIRTQFGRTLSKFQTIQHSVAKCAAEAALARAATDSALEYASRFGWNDSAVGDRIAIARSCIASAVETVVRGAHQVHGAIGTTAEHMLHRLSLPALAWRTEYGVPQFWDDVVSDRALAADASVWSYVLGEQAPDATLPVYDSRWFS